MSRSNFGGTIADWLFKPYAFGSDTTLAELATGDTVLHFYSAATGGTHYTDLLVGGLAATSVTASGHQVPQFQGPDGITAMWVDKELGSDSNRELMEARDLAAIAAAVAALPTKVSKYTLIDVVADHAADNTGVASAVTAFNAAIAAANSGSGKVEIYIPPGTYNLTASGTTAISQSSVYIRGAGRGVTTLNGGSGSMFTWGSGLDGGGLSDVTLSYTTPDSASRVISADNGHRLQFHRLKLQNVRQLARLGATSACGNIGFRDVYGYTDPTTGSIVIDACNGSALSLDNVVAYPLGIAAPTGTAAHPGTDLTFLRFGQGNWDTVHARGLITNRYGRGLDIVATGAVAVINMWFDSCVFDYNKYHGIRINATSGANVDHLFFNSGYVVASDGTGVEISGNSATIRHVHFTDVLSSQSGKNNWLLTGTSMDDVMLTNCLGFGANRLTGNTGSNQDDLVVLGSGVNVQGGRYGESGALYGLSGQGRYGANIGADLTVFRMVGVEATGASGNFVLNANTTGSFRRLVNGNRTQSAAAPAYAFASTVTAPTSAATQTHIAATLDTLYIYGGTVTDISHNGTTVGTTGPAALDVHPGDTWAVTYSVAPTIKRMVQA